MVTWAISILAFLTQLICVNCLPECMKENEVVHNYDITDNLLNDNWTICYFEPYSKQITKSIMITDCPVGDDYYLFIASLSTSTSTSAYIGAFAPSEIISEYTISTTTAFKPISLTNDSLYNIYWYNYPGSAFGFASNENIQLTAAFGGDDYGKNTDNDRLSWSLRSDYGGYRSGTVIDLRSDAIWHKIIYYKKCEYIVTPSPLIDTSSCNIENNIVHNYHVNNNLILKGWTVCYDELYAQHSSIDTLVSSCPTGDDYYYFIGSKATHLSTRAYIGAYVNSIVLSQYTESSYIAHIPFGMDTINDAKYNVYWYNYPGLAFGFAPNEDIQLTAAFGGDAYDKNTENDRLSWSLRSDYGGYRSGIWVDLRQSLFYRKIIYYKQCDRIVTPSPSINESINCELSNNIVHDYHIENNLIAKGWTLCYHERYSVDSEIGHLMDSCPINDDYYLFIGSKTRDSSPLIHIGAYLPSNVLSTYTNSTTIAYIPYPINTYDNSYNVYYYNYYDQAFGFAANKNIQLTTTAFGGDDYGKNTDNYRLSWSRKNDYGGYRSGIFNDLRLANNWKKLIYYKQCPNGWSLPSAQPMDGLCIMNEILHSWDIKINLENEGWTRCYFAPYSSKIDMNTLINNCSGDDYYVFVGVLPTINSTLSWMGAYGPSSVLSTTTTSTTTAYIPSKYATSPNYNVYWYNYPNQAFGFAPNEDIQLTDSFGGDYYDRTTDNNRLSWSLYNNYGGYRAGKFSELRLNQEWYKIVYYKYCPPTPAPTSTPTQAPTYSPSTAPTNPTSSPTISPSVAPTYSPTKNPTTAPSKSPTYSPTKTPTNAPTVAPTLAPSVSPTDSPSSAPTISPYRMIKMNGSYICSQLYNNIDIIYDISYDNCVYLECLYSYSSKCSMVNYIASTSSTDKSKCYIFGEQCEIYSDNNNNNNKIAIQGVKSWCIDYPSDWTDRSGDSCYQYSYILDWCYYGDITNISNFNQNSKDLFYNLDASATCCDCGGGAFDRNGVVLEFSKKSYNVLTNFNDLICDWPYGHKSRWYNYNNADLFDLCDKSNQLNDEKINCDIILDKSYSGDDNIILCNFDGDQYEEDELYFLSMFTMDIKKISNIYINQHWFNLNEELLYVRNKALIYYNYSECVSSLYNNEIIHGVFLCDADTLNPTDFPTMDPTKTPIPKPTEREATIKEQLEELFASNDLEQFSFFVNVSLIIFYLILIFLAICHAKTRQNEFFKVGNIIEALLQSLDIISDVFFAIHISIKYNLGDGIFGIMIIASWIFVFLPLIFSAFQLYTHSNYEWSKTNSTASWLTDYFTYLVIASFCTGSPFAAVLLMNSNMFNMEIFSMGLDKAQKNKFEMKRLWSVILCEDVPQLIMQSLYVYKLGTPTLITIFSILFSSLSVIITIISMLSVRNIFKKQNHIKFTLNITGKSVSSQSRNNIKNFKQIKNQISDILGESSNILQIFPATKIPNAGLKLEVHILYITNDQQSQYSVMTQYENLLNHAIFDGTLSDIIQKEWKLKNKPNISIQFDLISTNSTNHGVNEGVAEPIKQQIQMTHHNQIALQYDDD